MNFDDYCRRYNETHPAEVVEAAHFLEKLGLVFCGTFGYENAVAIARDVMSCIGEDHGAVFLWARYGIKLPASTNVLTKV